MWLRILDWIGLTNLTDKDIMRLETVHRGVLPDAAIWSPVWGAITIIAVAASAILPGYWKVFFFAVGCYAAIAAVLVRPAVNKWLVAPMRTPLVQIFGGFPGVGVLASGVLLMSIIYQDSVYFTNAMLYMGRPSSNWTMLRGTPSASPGWGSGWLDLSRPMSFQEGDRLKLTVGGTAERILVRLLPRGQQPDQPVGIIGAFDVVVSDTGTRTVELTLDSDYPNIVQISVHGNPNLFGLYTLDQNGGATLLKAQCMFADASEKTPTPQEKDPNVSENDLKLVISYPGNQQSRRMAQKLREIIQNITVEGWSISVYTKEKNSPVDPAEDAGHSIQLYYRNAALNDAAKKIWERISRDYENIMRFEDASIDTDFEIKIDVIEAE